MAVGWLCVSTFIKTWAVSSRAWYCGARTSPAGIQRSINNRWGDYTSLNIDPVDDCTMWYANEYYTLAGQISSVAGWNTRIASFKLPGCVAPN